MEAMLIMALFAYLPLTKTSFVFGSQSLLYKESGLHSSILSSVGLRVHLTSQRTKTFRSALDKTLRLGTPIYSHHDLMGCRIVFYSKCDMYTFKSVLSEYRNVTYEMDYFKFPKHNGYSAIHIRYESPPPKVCVVSHVEVQCTCVDEYYSSVYGKSRYSKRYDLLH